LGKPLVEVKEDGEAGSPVLNAQYFVERVWVRPSQKFRKTAKPAVLKGLLKLNYL
jgi:hypothetical protein